MYMYKQAKTVNDAIGLFFKLPNPFAEWLIITGCTEGKLDTIPNYVLGTSFKSHNLNCLKIILKLM